jgi:hypothetical protein
VSGNWTLRNLQSFDQRLYNRVSPVVAPVTRSFVSGPAQIPLPHSSVVLPTDRPPAARCGPRLSHPARAVVTTPQVTLNPRFHVVNATTGLAAPLLGSVQLDVPGPIWRNLVVNTTRLANGRNVLFFRCGIVRRWRARGVQGQDGVRSAPGRPWTWEGEALPGPSRARGADNGRCIYPGREQLPARPLAVQTPGLPCHPAAWLGCVGWAVENGRQEDSTLDTARAPPRPLSLLRTLAGPPEPYLEATERLPRRRTDAFVAPGTVLPDFIPWLPGVRHS